MAQVRQIAVIGAGIMGRGLARMFADGGWDVLLVDPIPGALDAAPERENITQSADLAAVAHCDLLIEAVPENIEIKRKVFADLEAHLGAEVPMLSNTSGLTLGELTRDMARPERFLIAHFFNPADVIPAVEVLPHAGVPEAMTEEVCDILRALGKRPVVLRKETPGFVANRIQHAIMRECLSLMEDGVADAPALDEIIRWSIGARMALNGPMLQRDMNGLDTHLAIATYLYPDLAADTVPSPLLAQKVAAGDVGRKAGRGFYEWGDGGQTAPSNALLARLIELSREFDGG
ncbi:MAG: 3-hydroxyacyl-CoA dehydrogenase NAD-binding domain-containing protein [Sulfitobacter sp.]